MTVLHLAAPVNYGCPDWCENVDHCPGELAANDGSAMHFGREFGPFSIQRKDDEPFEVMISKDDNDFFVTVDELKHLLRDGTSALRWLEAHS